MVAQHFGDSKWHTSALGELGCGDALDLFHQLSHSLPIILH
jgi:hypothetical protein